MTTLQIDSSSTGDPARHLSGETLKQKLEQLPPAPKDSGTVTLMVSCREEGRRELPDEVVLTPADGMPGDTWGRNPDPNPVSQLAVMQTAVAELIANGQPLPLFGDNLWLDLDLSNENLPCGSRLQIGDCVLEVTPQPHNGCHKFRARFGPDALKFVNDKELRHLNLRGIYLTVIEAGTVRVGDEVRVISRHSPVQN